MIILEELHQLYKYVCLVDSYKVSNFTAHILLVTVAPLLYVNLDTELEWAADWSLVISVQNSSTHAQH